MMDPRTARARDAELHAGDLTIFSDGTFFPGLLWNERFTNRVAYIPAEPGEAFTDAAKQRGAKWVVVAGGTSPLAVLHSRSDEWQEVGPASISAPTNIAYRRLP